MRSSIVVAIAICLVITVLSFVSCERGTSTCRGGVPPPASNNGTNRTLSIGQAIAEAREYKPPADIAGSKDFDPLVFEMLRKEFIRQIEANGNRITSAALTGDAGKVIDLTYDSGTGRLNWSYVNVGDYDSSGEVGIPDITMIAQYYLANTTDGIGDDALECWIDGDKSGEVGISDITPIAQGYLNYVSEYRILTSSQPDSGFTVVEPAIPFGSTGVFPHTFSVLLPVGVLQYVAVAPVDGDGAQGEMSDVVKIGDVPSITSVSQTAYRTGNEVQFSAAITGTTPFTYNWAFGGGAMPDTSTDESPWVTLGAEGSYSASLIVRNMFDSKRFEWTLTVEPAWQLEIVDGEGEVGENVSIALDSYDYPHISYSRWSNGRDLKYAYYNGNTWIVEVIDSDGDVGITTSIALDSNDHPHISYFDNTNLDLKYAYNGGSDWQIETVDATEDVGLFPSIGMDSYDFPHISYWDRGNDNLKYAYFDGYLWYVEIVDDETGAGSDTSLVLDSNDNPHISYVWYEGGTCEVRYANNDGSSWIIETVDNSEHGIWTTSLALDSEENPHISYHLFFDTMSSNLKYASCDGLRWSTEIIDYESTFGDYSSLKLDSNDNPHIAYCDFDNFDLKYACNNGSSWIVETVDSDGDTGTDVSIAIDSNDNPYISYCASTWDLKLAWLD